MSHARRFLCAVDLSEVSLKAARFAAKLAADSGGSLKLLYVYHVPPHLSSVGAPRHFADLSPSQVADLERSLEKARAELAEFGVPVETALEVGAPAEQLVKAASAQPTEMIVMGSVGHSRVRQMLLGSVVERVLRMSPVPVLIVPA